jgi:putative endonuclease
MKIANPIAVIGEDLATNYLKKHSYHILERNFRRGYGELDIIAVDTSEKEKTLVFIEVKTRKTNEFGTPFEAITTWKLRTLIKTAEFYVLTHPSLPKLLRIDAVSVVLKPDNSLDKIELMKNISG